MLSESAANFFQAAMSRFIEREYQEITLDERWKIPERERAVTLPIGNRL